jgi:hypothetical protein
VGHGDRIVTRSSFLVLEGLPIEDAVVRRVGVPKRLLVERRMAADAAGEVDVEIALAPDPGALAPEWVVRFIDVKDLKIGDRYHPVSLVRDMEICVWNIAQWGLEGIAYKVEDIDSSESGSSIPLSLCCRTFEVLSAPSET